MKNFLNSVKSTVSNPVNQRAAAHFGGTVLTFVVTNVVAGVINAAVHQGVDKLMDKIQNPVIVTNPNEQ